MDARLQAPAELFTKRIKVLNYLLHLCEHIEVLLHRICSRSRGIHALLPRLAKDVQQQVLGSHCALDEIQPLERDLVAIVPDKDTAHAQLKIVSLLLGLIQIEDCTP